jgi:GxxExxY protein
VSPERAGAAWAVQNEAKSRGGWNRGFTRDEPLRFDVLVEACVLVEGKAVEQIVPVHKAQLLSYMKLLDVPLGLLINFHKPN